MVIQKDVFWKAGIITTIVFMLGVGLGTMMESSRISDVREEYKSVEFEWADAKIHGSYFQAIDPAFCDVAIDGNLNFADRVYQEGLKIERYEGANNLANEDELLYEKRKYSLFKMEFWLNSINLKKKCNSEYINVLYFYLDDPDINTRSKQNTVSIILKELKENYGRQMMLIPIPLDLDIATVDLVKMTYNITTTPTILIDEKTKLEGLHTLDEINREIKNAIDESS